MADDALTSPSMDKVAINSNSTPTSCLMDNKSMENDALIESRARSNMTKKTTFNLHPVVPFTHGEGLPYAPEGWPNPGDIWGWKVGRRTNKEGYYHDRFLYVPKSLQKTPGRRVMLHGKNHIIHYLKSNFPNMDPGEFFALFTWKVPSTVTSLTSPTEVKSPESVKDATKEIATQSKLKRKAHHKLPTRKSSRLVHVCPLVQDANSNDVIDLSYLNEEENIESTKDLKASSDSDSDQPEYKFVGASNVADSEEGSGTPTVTIDENFDKYLNTLEDILILPLPSTETLSSNPLVPTILIKYEMAEHKRKLSSLLALDLHSLITSTNLVEIATLASRIRKDPSLGVDQVIKLRLVEEIPLVSEALYEAKRNIEEADKFFADLEAKKLKVPLLKMEFNELKNKIAQVKAEIETSSKAIQEIDDQITQLKSKRKEMSGALDTMHKTKLELTSCQARVANSIPTIVSEIQLGNSEIPKWEAKKACYAQRVAEIEEKFLTLRDLKF